jgi:hypothetical protein
MTPKEDFKVLASAAVAAAVSIGLGSLSALWLDRVLAPPLRGTDWDWLLFPSVVLIICGASYVWYVVYCWTIEKLDKRL